jgi:hypothetical protein
MVNQVTNRILGLDAEAEPAQFSEMGGEGSSQRLA